VWALFAVVALEIVFTYARVPVADLYHVSETGVAGGLGRALVFLGFPTALAALPVLGIAADRLLGSGLPPRQRRTVVALALVALPLLLSVVWPGVVDQGDLDARPVNALAGLASRSRSHSPSRRLDCPPGTRLPGAGGCLRSLPCSCSRRFPGSRPTSASS
jgi:hypothetical protein